MATLNKYSGLIQIGITILCFVFLVGASYRQSQETEIKTKSCELKIERMAEEQQRIIEDQMAAKIDWLNVVRRLEIAVAKLEERTEIRTVR